MTVSIPVVLLLLLLVGVLVWKGGLKWWHAAIAILAGFAIISWPTAAPIVGAILTGVVQQLNRL